MNAFLLMMRTFYVMKLAGCIKQTNTSPVSKDEGKLDVYQVLRRFPVSWLLAEEG